MLSRDARERRSTEDVGRRGRQESGTGDEEGLGFLREGALDRDGLVTEGFLGTDEEDVAVLIVK